MTPYTIDRISLCSPQGSIRLTGAVKRGVGKRLIPLNSDAVFAAGERFALHGLHPAWFSLNVPLCSFLSYGRNEEFASGEYEKRLCRAGEVSRLRVAIWNHYSQYRKSGQALEQAGK